MMYVLSLARHILLLILIVLIPLASTTTGISLLEAQDFKNLQPQNSGRVTIQLTSLVILEEFVIMQTGPKWIVIDSHGFKHTYKPNEIFSVSMNGVDITHRFPELSSAAKQSNLSDLQFIIVRQTILVVLIAIAAFFWQSAQIGS